MATNPPTGDGHRHGAVKQRSQVHTFGVGAKIDTANPGGKRIVTATRVHTMTPETTENLDRFVTSYNKWGFYLLAPAILGAGKAMPDILYDSGIVKHEFAVRNAWEIAPNDFDISLITDDSNPLIPSEVTEAPVIETLKVRKEAREARKKAH